MSRRVIVAGLVGTALLAVGAFAAWRGGVFGPATPPAATQSQPDAGASTAAPLTYVGSAACRDCHADEFQRWQQSQHAVAMQVADERTVLGDFSGVKYRNRGVTSEFFRRDGRFVVRTEGPDGKLADFEVRHTFGVYPLQQYLVELPGGRVQALSLAWDARPKDAGRATLVPPLSRRAHRAHRRAALDAAAAELELHVLRLPLDGRAQELRRCGEHLRDAVRRR